MPPDRHIFNTNVKSNCYIYRVTYTLFVSARVWKNKCQQYRFVILESSIRPYVTHPFHHITRLSTPNTYHESINPHYKSEGYFLPSNKLFTVKLFSCSYSTKSDAETFRTCSLGLCIVPIWLLNMRWFIAWSEAVLFIMALSLWLM